MQFLSMVGLVPDLAPRIYLRLPGPDLLQFARICKQTHALRHPVVENWAGQELDDIVALGMEQGWTRFFNLMANCGEVIECGSWTKFLDSIALQNKVAAQLMQLAVLSPAWGKRYDKLRIVQQPYGEGASEKILNILNRGQGAREQHWMEPLAGMALTGLWQHLSSGTEVALPTDLKTTFPEAFATLPLYLQVKFLPFLKVDDDYTQCDAGKAAQIAGAYAAVCRQHASVLNLTLIHPLMRFPFHTRNPAYLACLGRLFRNPVQAHCQTCTWIAQALGKCISRAKGIGRWQKQVTEFALLVFLALQCKADGNFLDETLKNVHIDHGFVTAQECDDFMRYMETNPDNSTYDKARLWLSRNFGKEASVHGLWSCTVS